MNMYTYHIGLIPIPSVMELSKACKDCGCILEEAGWEDECACVYIRADSKDKIAAVARKSWFRYIPSFVQED